MEAASSSETVFITLHGVTSHKAVITHFCVGEYVKNEALFKYGSQPCLLELTRNNHTYDWHQSFDFVNSETLIRY